MGNNKTGNSKIIFLDRDGVINRDLNSYVTGWDKFEFLDGSLEALRILTENGYKIVIISNQAGVSRGDYTVDELNAINEKMMQRIEEVAGKRPSAYYCTHTDEDNCGCRKPKTGSFTRAEKELGKVDYSGTYFIGDQDRDILTAKNLGTRSILVLSGKTSAEQLSGWKIKPDYVKRNLLDAVNWLIKGA